MDDKDLKPADIQTLASNDGVASFFATLGYDTDVRLPQTAAAMGITAESLQRQIKNIEQLAVQEDGAEPLYVYLVELISVTVAATQGLVRALRNRVAITCLFSLMTTSGWTSFCSKEPCRNRMVQPSLPGRYARYQFGLESLRLIGETQSTSNEGF